VTYQHAIEEVYWRHRIWPKENSKPKPPLDAVISHAQLEEKVEDYLCKSQLVTAQRDLPITAVELQAEIDRMANHSKQPQVLRELFEALGNDPVVIAECLGRPVLAERTLATNASLKEQLETRRSRAGKQTTKAVGAPSSSYTLPTFNYLNTGGRYNPNANSWTPTSTTNAPDSRAGHTAVWTGSEMIVWGGQDVNFLPLNTGGRYNPATDSWAASSTIGAPAGRWSHTAVWTGTEMIVWGGVFFDGSNYHYLNTGGRYNPTTDSWTATSNVSAPTGRADHTAVWTGIEMIVWGGDFYDGSNHYLNTGGRYNPGTDSWTPSTTTNAPTARGGHTSVWTGSEMIVWGGGSYLNTGGRYNPGTDSWTATSTTGAPVGRLFHTAVWAAGNEMIVWGGAPSIIFDTNTGGRYNPSTDSWTATSIGGPEPRQSHTAIWTGSEMIVWGGENTSGEIFFDGGKYNPGMDSWAGTSITNAPEARYGHTAVWTGSEMIVWGGRGAPSPTPTPTATATSTATATATATATSTASATATPRITPTPRARPMPAPRP
jgi:N-acetylneuraminic acid mutarotase